MSKFFIRRPIVAIVIAILTVVVGVITVALLPIAQFPNIAPPEIWLQANYPGADAKTLEQSVATPIEQQITGVDNMEYMYSVNTTNGSQTSLIVDFDLKTDPNTDLVLTQSRQQLANGQLPPEVTSYGISLRKSATAPFMLVGLYSPHGTRDAAFLSNYAYINLNDPIGRSYGVGRSEVFGAGQYAMRLWIKPDQLAKLGITVTDITNAIQAQNKVNPAGQIGGEPAQKNQQFTYALLAKGRLRSPEQFGNIVVRESPNGGTVRVKDVARVELGQQDYSTISRLNGKPTAIIAIYQLPGSNALQTAEGVRKLMAGMKDRLPEDVDYAISLDQTLPVSEGMRAVVETLVIALVLASVFVPTAFIPGITGRLYQQFALTIAISVILSAFNALTLSPALAGLLLRPKSEEGTHKHRGPLGKFFDAFNRYWQRSTNGFVHWSHAVIRKGALVMVLLVLFGLGAFFFGNRLPSSFMPDEDQGYLYVSMQLPIAASMQRTSEAGRQVENVLANIPGVQYTTSVIGFNLLSFAHTSYNGFFFVTLKPWSDRKSRAEQYQEIKTRLNQELNHLPQGAVFGFSPPAVPGVGTSGGFQFVLEDRAGKDVKLLADNLNKFLAAARKRPEIGLISTTFIPSVPQQFVNVDQDKVLKQGVAISDVYQTIQAYMGGLFVNYFNDFGRTWQVYIEAEAPYRANTQDLSQFYVRNNQGQNVPLSSLANFETAYGPEFTLRYNEYRGAQIFGSAAPGYSSQQATAALEDVFNQTMPHEMGFDYMGMSYQEQKARQGVPAWAIFVLPLLFVFLILAALYESWTLPFSVLLSTPVAVFGALAALWLRRFIVGLYMPPYMVQMENDVYTQIGLVMLIGLGAKNSILIVAFAKEDYDRGMSLVDAALSAARLRFRPLMMTALAFIVGCVPLWIASGAGSVARQIIGTTVIGGMLAETVIGRVFVSADFYVV